MLILTGWHLYERDIILDLKAKIISKTKIYKPVAGNCGSSIYC